MVVLITGGSGSGKSEFAENLAVKMGKPLTYIATMRHDGEEAQRRISRHHALRRGKGFDTVECYTDIDKLTLSGTVLLECMSNLLANEMFTSHKENAVRSILDGVDKINKQCDNLIIVTNEVSSDGIDYGGETEKYMKNLGALNCYLALKADRVYEVVCGVAREIKKEDKSCIF